MKGLLRCKVRRRPVMRCVRRVHSCITVEHLFQTPVHCNHKPKRHSVVSGTCSHLRYTRDSGSLWPRHRWRVSSAAANKSTANLKQHDRDHAPHWINISMISTKLQSIRSKTYSGSIATNRATRATVPQRYACLTAPCIMHDMPSAIHRTYMRSLLYVVVRAVSLHCSCGTAPLLRFGGDRLTPCLAQARLPPTKGHSRPIASILRYHG